MNNCPPLWRAARFQVNMHKAHHVPDHIFKLLYGETFTPLYLEAHLHIKTHKTHQVRTTEGSSNVENGTPMSQEVHVQVKKDKTHQERTTFESLRVEKCLQRKSQIVK